ncbi:hypothetical protein AB0M50_11380, partial [Nonomuraea fuscirosea]|uniref:hypothetical protein n=1 Tax=Nonomuraea fuscirosea TaxID=1291556 RepID=UPI00341A0B92
DRLSTHAADLIGQPLTTLADLANLATFGGAPVDDADADLANLATFGGAPVDDADAELAWRHHATVDGLVRRRSGVARRLVTRLSPLSLFG